MLLIRAWRQATLLGSVWTMVGCSEPLSSEECSALLDHYVTVLTASDRPGTNDTELVRLRAQAREKAARDPAFRRCAHEVSRSKFECAMKAASADHLEQCLL